MSRLKAALALVVVLGTVLVEAYEGVGGAAAAVATEAVLALLLLGLLARTAPDVTPRAGVLPRTLAAAAAGTAVAFVPLSAWIVAPLAAAAFLAVAFGLRAIPPEVVTALRRRDPS